MAKILSINVSDQKGTRKKPLQMAIVRENFGIDGDAHASENWHRQISLLAMESIEKMRQLGLKVNPGDFAENITTEGIDLKNLAVGTKLKVGSIIVEVTQIGKECHTRCAIYRKVGDCIMPKEGIFVKILKGGVIKIGDPVDILTEE